MTPRTTDNTNFWRLVQQYLRAGVHDNYGTSPSVPADAMLTIAQRIALRDGWMRLRAPRGFEWDGLTQSYRETLR